MRRRASGAAAALSRAPATSPPSRRAPAGSTCAIVTLTEHLARQPERQPRPLCAARCAGLDDGRRPQRAVARDHAHRPARRARDLPHRRRGQPAARPRRRRRCSSRWRYEAARSAELHAARPLGDLRRLPSLRPAGAGAHERVRRSAPRSAWTASTARSGIIYDLTRRPYLLGRDGAHREPRAARRRARAGDRLRHGPEPHPRRRALSRCAASTGSTSPRPCWRRRGARSRARVSARRIVVAQADATSFEPTRAVRPRDVRPHLHLLRALHDPATGASAVDRAHATRSRRAARCTSSISASASGCRAAFRHAAVRLARPFLRHAASPISSRRSAAWRARAASPAASGAPTAATPSEPC